MTGPYTAQIFLNVAYTNNEAPSPNADLTLKWGEYEGGEWIDAEGRDLLVEGDSISYRYYRSGQGATLLGTLRAATFAAASLIEPGEQAVVAIFGREVARSGDAPVRVQGSHVRRDASGRLFTTLGSDRTGNERWFKGL